LINDFPFGERINGTAHGSGTPSPVGTPAIDGITDHARQILILGDFW
jgi:hypothetical protein